MLRLLLLLLLAFAAGIVARVLLASRSPGPSRPEAPKALMLKCEHCQVYVPEQEAVRAGDRVYCSAAHMKHHEAERK